MGRVLVEAGAMAKPVVATKVSGIPELVAHGSTGILVEPRSAKALAQGIMELLSDPAKARVFGENARLKMTDDFSADNMVGKIEDLYRKIWGLKHGGLRQWTLS